VLQNSAPHPGSAVAHPDGIVTRIGTDTTKPHRWSQPPSASIRFIRSNPWLFSTCPSLEKLWIATRFRSAHFLADPILWSLNRSSALACAGGLRTTMTTNSFRRAFAPYPPPAPFSHKGRRGRCGIRQRSATQLTAGIAPSSRAVRSCCAAVSSTARDGYNEAAQTISTTIRIHTVSSVPIRGYFQPARRERNSGSLHGFDPPVFSPIPYIWSLNK